MKISETEFKYLAVPYKLYGELEAGLKENIEYFERKGLICQNLSVMCDVYNPAEMNGRLCYFMVTFKRTKGRKMFTTKR